MVRQLGRARLAVVPIVVVVIVIIVAVVVAPDLIVMSLLAKCWSICLCRWSILSFVVMKDGLMRTLTCPTSGPRIWAEFGDVFIA